MKALDRRLLRHAPGVARFLAVGVGLASVVACALIVQAHGLAALVSRPFVAGAGVDDLTGPLACVGAGFGARAVVAWLTPQLALPAAASAKAAFRQRALAAVARLGPAQLARHRDGGLAAALTTGLDTLDEYLASYLPAVAGAVVIPPAMVAWSFRLDPTSALVLLVTLPLVPAFMVLIGAAAQRRTQRRWLALQRLSSHFLDVLRGLGVLRLYGRSDDQAATIRRAAEALRDETLGTLRVAFLSAFVLELVSMLGTATVAVLLGLRLVAGDVALEPSLAVLLLAPEAYLPLRRLAVQFHAAQDTHAVAATVAAVLEAERDRPRGVVGLPNVRAADLRLEHVTVRRADGVAVLTDVTTTVAAGQWTAVVGASGAGKTTLASLLLAFEAPTSGRVVAKTDVEHDLASVDPAGWQRQVAWVSHHPALVAGTVADNLRRGAEDATDAEMRAAAERVGAAAFVTALADGYATVVGPGGRGLSAGQGQRLAMARVLLADADLVVLDEPSADLDVASEAAVRDAIGQLARGRTVVMLTHRPTLAAAADRIVVLDRGRVVEQGRPADLLGGDGPYTRLVSACGEVAA